MKTIVTALTLVVVAAACDELPVARDCAAEATTADEHEIIGAVLRAQLGNRVQDNLVVRGPTTAADDFDASYSENALVDELIDRNATALTIEVSALGDVGATVVIVPAAEIPSRAQRQTEPWLQFEEAWGVDYALHVSRPGIGCGEATVYVVNDCGSLCSEGLIFELQRDDGGAWFVVATDQVWIS